MNESHHLFGWSSLVWYDAPSRWADPAAAYPVTGSQLPDGWERTEQDGWVVLTAPDSPRPAQGWKIHLSAGCENDDRVLARVWEYCVANQVSFKHLRDRGIYLVFNSKYAPREASGKLATIYPVDDGECHRILTELSAVLSGERGPYILSDLRWGDGPLFVRYGGFRRMTCLTADGDLDLAVRRPDGRLVPDRRRPTFELPGWVRPPGFLAEPLAQRPGSGGADFPYRVEKALHFSNGGGVYLAERLADGVRVVLKEARPLAGLDRQRRDAVTRLRRERDIMARLAGVPGVPAVCDYFTAWEHDFLAVEYVEGDPLYVWAGREHALLQPDPTAADLDTYAGRARALLDRVEDLVAAVHARGIAFGDLHPGNILVRADGAVALIDFETAFAVDDAYRPAMGAQGFAAPWCTSGEEMDRYSLAALRIWALLPLNTLFVLDPGKIARVVRAATERFRLPAEYGARILRDMGVDPGSPQWREPPALPAALAAERRVLLGEPLAVDLDGPEPDWAQARTSMAEAILLSATPDRPDRLFPGDPRQWRYDGVGFAYGAAGVLWALSECGVDIPPEHEEWLLRAVRAGVRPQPGFYCGAHGIAYVLDMLGHPGLAADVLAGVADQLPALRAPGLFAGLAGVGLNLLHFAGSTGDTRYCRMAMSVADQLTGILDEGPAGSRVGLMHGWSGPALFFARLYQATGDESHVDYAVRALHRDLDACLLLPNGTLQVEESGVRTLAYLESGSAGIALVADEVLRHRDDARLRDALPAIARACTPELVVETHLFNGRAGLLATLARLRHHDLGWDSSPAVGLHLRQFLRWGLSYRGRLAFAGDQSLRLSMDLATGTAGVLLAMSTAVTGAGPFLPFFTTRTARDHRLAVAGAGHAPLAGSPFDSKRR